MKILYLSIGEASEGVRKKLIDKTNFLRLEGLDIRLCLVGSKAQAKEEYVSDIPVSYAFARWLDNKPMLWRLSVFAEQRNSYRKIFSFLQNNSFDIILFRYPVADYFLWRFMRYFKGKVIFEHNTIEEYELRLRKADSFYYRYFYLGEKFFGKRVRSLASGLIGVTQEITAYQVKLADHTIPNTTISNGINVDRVQKRRSEAFNGKELNLLLLAGSAAPWHGVDILLKSIIGYSGNCKVHCYIAGSISNEQRIVANSLNSVTVLPNQTGEALNRLVDICHVGVGTLGFTLEFMSQACPLKVREYWARGIPFVIGYEDTDLIHNQAMEPFHLKFDNVHPFNLEDVISFAHRVYEIPDLPERIRSLAFRHIHYKTKAEAYQTFFNTLKG